MPDRNFDDLTEHFEKKIYKGQKGKIRQTVIRRDLQTQFPELLKNQSLNILDIGAGLGQFSVEFAKQGHQVTYNDISENMMLKAKSLAIEANVEDQIQWNNQPYQDFSFTPKFYDLVLCHAVLEWLEKPEVLIATLENLLSDNGWLSLCFYNPVGLVYRNLICGNFRYLNTIGVHQADTGSLTPMNPCSIEQVTRWLANHNFKIVNSSGIRVFSDYVLDKRGGNLSEEDVIKVELEYSSQEPYKNLGRYFHMVAKNSRI
jgi:S-adenosylmethionine-dependent methyltransferase